MRVLLVRLSSFGDVVFAMPAARALKDAAGAGVHLTWAIEPPLAPLVEGAPYVDAVLPVNTRGWRREWRASKTRREIREFSRTARAGDFDLVVDAQGLFKSALVTAVAGVSPAGRRVGFGWRTATERVNCLVTGEHVDVDRAARPHVLDQMLALAEHVTGRAGFDRTPDVRHLAGRPDPAVDAWLERYGQRPFALLQPFSSKVTKTWGDRGVLEFSAWLSSEGIQPVLRWGPGEESRAESLLALSRQSPVPAAASRPLSLPLLLAPPTTPASTARLAARAALFVGADTGPTHLAAAAGAPTLALFGPTPPERFAPVGPSAAFLRESSRDYNRSGDDGPRWLLPDVIRAARRLGA